MAKRVRKEGLKSIFYQTHRRRTKTLLWPFISVSEYIQNSILSIPHIKAELVEGVVLFKDCAMTYLKTSADRRESEDHL